MSKPCLSIFEQKKPAPSATRIEETSMEPIRLRIEGGSGPGGIEAVENALRTVPGVMSVRLAAVARDEILVEAAETVSAESLVEAVENAGHIAVVIG
jgi:copper chaperone CopZ